MMNRILRHSILYNTVEFLMMTNIPYLHTTNGVINQDM